VPGDEDGVVLTDHEREVLAGLAATIEDPWLAQQLLGVDGPPPPPAPAPRPAPGTPPRLRPWVGAVLSVLGALLYLTAFTLGPWAAATGIAVMAASSWILWHDRIRRQAGSSPGTTPSP
jgi:hypothetical protein